MNQDTIFRFAIFEAFHFLKNLFHCVYVPTMPNTLSTSYLTVTKIKVKYVCLLLCYLGFGCNILLETLLVVYSNEERSEILSEIIYNMSFLK